MSDDKIYLGDSVYADFDGERITLTTENGYGPSNTIVLEPEGYHALLRWVDRLQKRALASVKPRVIEPSEG